MEFRVVSMVDLSHAALAYQAIDTVAAGVR
jgi:hypothetical protein